MGYPDGGAPRGRRPTACASTTAPPPGRSPGPRKHGGETASTPARAAADADFVFVCVGNDADVRSVMLGGRRRAGGHVRRCGCWSTTRPPRRILRGSWRRPGAAQGVGFLDAPVSGGQAGAENGQLTIMIGGDEETFAAAEPVMGLLRPSRTPHGRGGRGTAHQDGPTRYASPASCKDSPRGCTSPRRPASTWTRWSTSSARAPAQSWQMDNRAGTMARREFEFGFAVQWDARRIST